MPHAPAADQRRLLDVQDADIRLSQARHRRDNLPLNAQIEELAGRAKDLEEDAIARGADVSDLRREVAKAEDDVQAVRSRAERDRARLESGNASAKDLQALQAELEVLNRRQATLEDIELEAMERLETAEKLHADARTQRDAITAEIATLSAQRDAQVRDIDDEIGNIEAERALTADGLDPSLVALYDKLRAHHGGVGAAALEGSRCGGCHMTLNPADLRVIEAAAPDAVLRCEECGRILVRATDPVA